MKFFLIHIWIQESGHKYWWLVLIQIRCLEVGLLLGLPMALPVQISMKSNGISPESLYSVLLLSLLESVYKGIQSDAQVTSPQVYLFPFFQAGSLAAFFPPFFCPAHEILRSVTWLRWPQACLVSSEQDGGRRSRCDSRAASPFSSGTRHLGEILLLKLFKQSL